MEEKKEMIREEENDEDGEEITLVTCNNNTRYSSWMYARTCTPMLLFVNKYQATCINIGFTQFGRFPYHIYRMTTVDL